MSDTPKTDALVARTHQGVGRVEIVAADWARTLERLLSRCDDFLTRAIEDGESSVFETNELLWTIRHEMAGRAAAEGSADEKGESKSGAGSASAGLERHSPRQLPSTKEGA